MNKIMEYMALGKPIVQFDVTEGRFSAQDSSLYAKANDAKDFGEKILELLDDPARRALMGESGRKRVQEVLAWPHEQPKLLRAMKFSPNCAESIPAFKPDNSLAISGRAWRYED